MFDAQRRLRAALAPDRASLFWYLRQIPEQGEIGSVHYVAQQQVNLRNHSAAEGAQPPKLRKQNEVPA